MDVIYSDNRINEYKNQKKSVESLEQAKERLAIIESRPCIEFWFLLHYKNTDKCFVNCDKIWLVKGISTPLPEIINCTKQKLVKEKIKKYINGCY